MDAIRLRGLPLQQDMHSGRAAISRQSLQTPPSMAQPDYIEITLRNGGWDGLTSKQYTESDTHAVASRVVELAKDLVLADAGVTFRCGHMMAILQRETRKFCFLVTWIDYRFGNEQGSPIAMADDDRNQVGQWAFNVARVQLHAMQLDRQVQRMALESEQHAQMKLQIEHAKEQGFQAAAPPLPAPPQGVSAMEFMRQNGRLNEEWFPSTPSTHQQMPENRACNVGIW